MDVRYSVTIATLCMLAYGQFGNASDELVLHKQSADCSNNGDKLYGRIQFVTSFPDIKVKVVTSFPDLKVKIVENAPTKCGEWKIVNEFPDLKVQLVVSAADIKIQFVQSFPGTTDRK